MGQTWLNTALPASPPDLAAMLEGYVCVKDSVGRSAAGVYRCQSEDGALYLKITEAGDDIRRVHTVMRWLTGKLPVPEVRYFGEQDGLIYLLMTEVPGRMACDCPEDRVTGAADNTVRLLADGLLMLQAIDITDCPVDDTLDIKLAKALYNIENSLVDMADWNEDTPFASPMELYRWLDENRPPEELSFTHGDYCLPNVFIDGAKVTGFIDFMPGGIADKWQDIALCVRSLRYNLGDMPEAEKDTYIDLLFSRLGTAPDEEKIRYYILLDELF